MKLPDKVYDILKWVTLVFLPALTTFVGVILNSFNVPNTEIILTIMVALTTFMGSLLGLSTIKYNKENKEN